MVLRGELVFVGNSSIVLQLDCASVLVVHLDRRLVYVCIISFFCHAYPAFVPHPRSPRKNKCSRWF